MDMQRPRAKGHAEAKGHAGPWEGYARHGNSLCEVGEEMLPLGRGTPITWLMWPTVAHDASLEGTMSHDVPHSSPLALSCLCL